MDVIVDLAATKAALQEVLGSKYPYYLSLMRDWFKGKLNKLEFDDSSEKLLTAEFMHLREYQQHT
jgi:hypothetical protein